MPKDGPIVIVEDNKDERSLYRQALANLKIHNLIHFFENGREALDYLETTKENPFIIICDIRMPKMNGIELRQKISDNPYLKKKAIPFVFRTKSTTSFYVHKAYELAVQGFFKKSPDLEKIEHQLKMILDYWCDCLEPNDDIL